MQYYKKRMTPQGEEYVDSAPHTSTDSIMIQAPRSAVWSALDDTPGFASWFPGVRSGSMVVPAEKGLGAKRLAQLNRIKYFEEIVAYRENEAWGFTMLESSSGACKSITEVVYLEPVDDASTEVTYKGGYEFAGPYRLISGVMGSQISKVWEGALAGLKAHVEAGHAK